jgi:hypothetical protein
MSKWTLNDVKKLGLNVSEPFGKTEQLPVKQKYNNRKTNGFDSKHEYECYCQLELKQKAGLITALCCQVSFQLIKDVKYVADFTYYDIEQKKFIIADAKGMKTQTYILKKKMMKDPLGIEILEM